MSRNYLDELKNFIEEKTGWSISDTGFGPDSEPGWELSQYSPAGEDFSFGVCHNNDYEKAIEDIKDYANNFDEDEHIEMWIEARHNGVAGVPSTRELVEDAKDIHEMLKELAGDVLTWQAHLQAELAHEHVRKPALDDVIHSCEALSKETNDKHENKMVQMPGTEGDWGKNHWNEDKDR